MFDAERDARVRLAAFRWLEEQVERHGDVLPREVLAQGFAFEEERVPLVGPQGIFKPRLLREVPLSITTAPDGPYDDSFGVDGLLRYRYRGSNPNHPENVGLRTAMRKQIPLMYFHGIVPGRYEVVAPVLIVGDDPAHLTFAVAVEDARRLARLGASGLAGDEAMEAGDRRREYITALVRRRMHQRAFRERVLMAYRRQCAFCRLRHEELLDAAHIIPDKEPEGEPVVPNGLSLCKLHHAAFDQFFVGVRPELTLEVRKDILMEKDGPTLVHAIQALHGTPIIIPSRSAWRPNRDLLAERYERFRSAGAA